MNATTLCAVFASTGLLQGLGLDAEPADWDRALAGDRWTPLIDSRKGRMRRDYGLVEVHFVREGLMWRCIAVVLQVHRLDGGYEETVPPGLRGVVDSGDTQVLVADLLAYLDARGVSHELIADREGSREDRHWVAAGAVIVASVHGAGVVWSASTSVGIDAWRRPVT